MVSQLFYNVKLNSTAISFSLYLNHTKRVIIIGVDEYHMINYAMKACNNGHNIILNYDIK